MEKRLPEIYPSEVLLLTINQRGAELFRRRADEFIKGKNAKKEIFEVLFFPDTGYVLFRGLSFSLG
jgi:hypothetical protein